MRSRAYGLKHSLGMGKVMCGSATCFQKSLTGVCLWGHAGCYECVMSLSFLSLGACMLMAPRSPRRNLILLIPSQCMARSLGAHYCSSLCCSLYSETKLPPCSLEILIICAIYVCLHMCTHVCVFVCVRKRETETERDREKETPAPASEGSMARHKDLPLS